LTKKKRKRKERGGEGGIYQGTTKSKEEKKTFLE